MDEKKKKYEVTRWAAFTETIYATSEEEAKEAMDSIVPRFASPGDFIDGHTEIENVQCPRCQESFQYPESKSECPHCNLPFDTEEEVEER